MGRHLASSRELREINVPVAFQNLQVRNRTLLFMPQFRVPVEEVS